MIENKEEQIHQKIEEIRDLRESITKEREAEKHAPAPLISVQPVDPFTPERGSHLLPYSSIKKSLYADKYMSPARRIAQEVREEILSRSMDRAKLNDLKESIRTSPDKNNMRMSYHRVKYELEESKRWWDDRYSSPVKYGRYFSPRRTNLELERLQEQKERERIKVNLEQERQTLARISLERDLELKRLERESEQRREEMRESLARESTMAHSNYNPNDPFRSSYNPVSNRDSYIGQTTDNIDPDRMTSMNKSRMIVNLKDSIWDNKRLEDKRIDCSLRYDFCLSEFFEMFHATRNGHLSLFDLEKFCSENHLFLNRTDCVIIIERFDIDNDGLLSFTEFCSIFLPKQHEFRDSILKRQGRNIKKFTDYTPLTQEYIKDLLKLVVRVQEKFAEIKFRLSDGRV